jgi:uncharacterized coiled-coil protein SlyX
MQFNEFNRRLEKCHLDQDTKFLLSHLFETVVELNKQMDTTANLITELVNTISNVVTLHADTQEKMKSLMRSVHAEVKSVREDF